MYYIIYQITNTINNKIYVGCHQTLNKNDSYMGSGTYLRRAQKKQGLQYFQKVILRECSNIEEMFDYEAMIVDENFIQRLDTYNIKLGGKNWDSRTAKLGRQMTNQILLKKHGPNWRKIVGQQSHANRSREHYKEKGKIAQQTIMEKYGHGYTLGSTHTTETKRKIGFTNSLKQKGSKNSQYGKRWIYSDKLKINKSVHKSEVTHYLAIGWLLGRKMKF